MIDFIKRQRAGFYIGVCALILVIIGTIVQAVNVNSVGYFQGKTIPGIGVLSALSIIFLIVGVCLRELRVRFPGLIGNIMDFVGLLFLAVVPILLSIAFMNFIYTRAEGLAFILASDDNTRANNQTPENMASVGSAITGIIFYVIATLTSLVGVFFKTIKVEEETTPEVSEKAE